jgi:hypothetical protein
MHLIANKLFKDFGQSSSVSHLICAVMKRDNKIMLSKLWSKEENVKKIKEKAYHHELSLIK